MDIIKNIERVFAFTDNFAQKHGLDDASMSIIKSVVMGCGAIAIQVPTKVENIKADYLAKVKEAGSVPIIAPEYFCKMVDLAAEAIAELSKLDIPAADQIFVFPTNKVKFRPQFPEADGICPVCGGALAFDGDHEIVDDYTRASWTCPECNATGRQWSNIVFSEHRDLLKNNEVPFSDEELADLNLKCGKVCPMCGGALEYLGDQEIECIDGASTSVSWVCARCNTSGVQWNDIVFSEHVVDE